MYVGNGGEYRKSFHGYPKGYAQLLQSPEVFSITPMQIDTWNRDYNGTDFKAGPLPSASLAPPAASYSGLLECPCTDRMTKITEHNYPVQPTATCQQPITTASDCYDSVAYLNIPNNFIITNQTVNDLTGPPACSIVSDPTQKTAVLSFNTANAPSCGSINETSYHLKVSDTNNLVGIDLEIVSENNGLATLTLSGPADVWYVF